MANNTQGRGPRGGPGAGPRGGYQKPKEMKKEKPEPVVVTETGRHAATVSA